MEYLVVSDIHENFHNLKIALDYAKSQKVTVGFALGDLINPGIMHKLGESQIDFKIVLGNNDGDKFELLKVSTQYTNIELKDLYAEYEIENKKIFLCHYDRLGFIAAQSGLFTSVFCGHNHQFNSELIANNRCLLANPGELSGHMYGKATFGIWDSINNTFKILSIKSGWVDVKKYKRDNESSSEVIELDQD